MYQSHWGLRESPFRTCLDPQAFYESPSHEEALARLHFLVDEHRRLGLLTGPGGSGKSLLLEVFAGQLRRNGREAAHLNLLGLAPADVLAQLAMALHQSPNEGDSVGQLWRIVTDRLLELRYCQRDTAVLLDDADRASPEVLDLIARLAQYDRSPGSRLTLVVAADSQRIVQLGDRLPALCDLRIGVEPWQPTDTAAFLDEALHRAGRDATVFDPAAVARLHELTGGIPRRVNQLADLALVAGAGAQLDSIDAGVIESLYPELGLPEPVVS